MDIPVNCPFPPDSYFWDITHDEYRILFGGPSILESLVSSEVLRDRESEELHELLEFIEEIQELIYDGEADASDRRALRESKLRVTRLTKVPWNDADHEGCSIQ
jgi:predicted house-cleaning noncanonical NTP pyrophosphatase (MazG superfamily)